MLFHHSSMCEHKYKFNFDKSRKGLVQAGTSIQPPIGGGEVEIFAPNGGRGGFGHLDTFLPLFLSISMKNLPSSGERLPLSPPTYLRPCVLGMLYGALI